MAETPTLPQLQLPAFPASSDVPTISDLQATDAGPAERPYTKWRWTSGATVLALIIAIVANIAVIAAIAERGDSASAITARPEVRALPAVPPAPLNPPGASTSVAALATAFGEGKFVVGTDIAPGTYQTAGKSGHLDCYWERLKDTHGDTDSIIANNLAPGPATVTIAKTDAAFQTRWCNTWTKVN